VPSGRFTELIARKSPGLISASAMLGINDLGFLADQDLCLAVHGQRLSVKGAYRAAHARGRLRRGAKHERGKDQSELTEAA
jgi:hypothetical protein